MLTEFKQMGKRKKKQILCAQTGLTCEWYKKGKKHRVLVRSDGVIIANNPLPLVGILGAAAVKKAAAAGAVSAGAGFLTSKLLNRGKKDKEEGEAGASPSSSSRPATYDNLDRPNPGSGAWYIDKVLKGEV